MSNPKPTLIDIAKAAGVGVATVDRVINKRAPVREPTRQRVYKAASELGMTIKNFDSPLKTAPTNGQKKIAIVLQRHNPPFYQTVTDALTAAAGQLPARIVEIDGMQPEEVASTLLTLGDSVEAIGVVAADHPLVSQAIEQLSRRGVQVFGFMSELTASHRAGYVGIDNRRAGRTAGWAIAHLCRRPGKVATLMGDHRLLCQEYSEIGLRSYLREYSNDFEVLEPILSLESPDRAWQATHELLAKHADIVGLYVNSGCVEGVIRALRETGRHREIVTVCHEVTDDTRAALIDNVVQVVVAHPLAETARTLINALSGSDANEHPGTSHQWIVPVSVLTAENI